MEIIKTKFVICYAIFSILTFDWLRLVLGMLISTHIGMLTTYACSIVKVVHVQAATYMYM